MYRTGWYLLLIVPFALAIAFGVTWLLTKGAVWAMSGFGYDAPFWPTFVAILVLSSIFGGRTVSSSKG